jgi:hypothetical protein
MIGGFRRASAEQVEWLLGNPETIWHYLDPDNDDGAEEGRHAGLDVDKAWHGIHFLLTGTAWEGEPPLDFIVRGGQEVGEDLGYGPARAFTSDEVKAIAAALRPLTREVLEQRFNPKEMMSLQIYPTIWDRPRDEDDTLEYVLGYYDALRDFIEGAAKEGEGLIAFVT